MLQCYKRVKTGVKYLFLNIFYCNVKMKNNEMCYKRVTDCYICVTPVLHVSCYKLQCSMDKGFHVLDPVL